MSRKNLRFSFNIRAIVRPRHFHSIYRNMANFFTFANKLVEGKLQKSFPFHLQLIAATSISIRHGIRIPPMAVSFKKMSLRRTMQPASTFGLKCGGPCKTMDPIIKTTGWRARWQSGNRQTETRMRTIRYSSGRSPRSFAAYQRFSLQNGELKKKDCRCHHSSGIKDKIEAQFQLIWIQFLPIPHLQYYRMRDLYVCALIRGFSKVFWQDRRQPRLPCPCSYGNICSARPRRKRPASPTVSWLWSHPVLSIGQHAGSTSPDARWLCPGCLVELNQQVPSGQGNGRGSALLKRVPSFSQFNRRTSFCNSFSFVPWRFSQTVRSNPFTWGASPTHGTFVILSKAPLCFLTREQELPASRTIGLLNLGITDKAPHSQTILSNPWSHPIPVNPPSPATWSSNPVFVHAYHCLRHGRLQNIQSARWCGMVICTTRAKAPTS